MVESNNNVEMVAIMIDVAMKQILEDAVEYVIKRNEVYPYLDSMNTKQVLKEMKTIRIKLPRRSGHTTAAITVLPLYFNKIAYIVPNRSIADHVKKMVVSTGLDVIVYKQPLHTIFAGKKYDCIVIDPVSPYFTEDELEKIYDMIALYDADEVELVVLLG